MMLRILPFLMLPLLGFSQTNSKVEIPIEGTTTSEKKPLEINRNAQYNLEEIKVRWKKAALENCPEVPCITATTAGAPTSVVATTGVASASVAFVAPTSDGGSAITGYTVTSSPGGIIAMGASSPINVIGLTNGTAYTFTVVANNAVGNSVASAASSAVTPAPPACGSVTSVSDIDMNSYTTVSIGTQCWTATNLKVTKYNDNTGIPLNAFGGPSGTSGTWAVTFGACTIYGNELSTSAIATNYGFLYNWYAATDSRKICPTGYHVPTDSDWNKLVKFIDSGADTTGAFTQSTSAGTKLKKNDALWTANTGTDDYGFSALPGGYRNNVGSFDFIGSFASFWSATEDFGSSGFSWPRSLNSSNNVGRSGNLKSAGASIRCLRD